MIALQSRNPQLPDPSRGAAQFANMMNMASQQRASQLQAERTRQEMDNAAAQEARAAQTQTATMREKDVDFQLKDMKRLRNIGVAVLESGNEEAYQSWLGMIDQSDKQFGDTIRQVAPTFNAKVLQTVLMEADKYIDKSVATPVASLEVDVSGNPRSVTVGGLNPQQSPVYDAPETPVATPRATPTSPQAASANPMAPGYKPNTAAADPGSLSLVINSALETGVMAKTDFDKMLSLAPPESRAKIAAWAQQNNIQVTPDVPGVTDNQMRGTPNEMRASPMSYDGQTPESQFAVYRGEPMQSQTAGLRGAPPMEQTLAQTQPRTITKLQQRNPNVSPLPGSAQVPLSRVAGEAEARRETPAQITARKNAELQATEAFEETNKDKRLARKRQEVFEGERAKKDAAFLDSYNDAATKGRTTLNVIDQMIGDAQLEKGKLVVPKGGRRPHPGFEGVVGMGVPGVRFIPGTQAASFDALFRQAEGGAFLQAYESLRGTGQITEIEGSKATSALTRMERSQTEVEFVKAAREFANVIRGAVARADKRYTALTGEAPPAAAAQRKTSTKSTLSAATRKKYGL
jgi:hypothetical protein